MTAIAKSVQTQTFANQHDYVPSFQETYQVAYSHGLETIYKLENVDLKSVRRISVNPEISVLKVENFAQDFIETEYSFDFGAFFQGWMHSFVPQEPIQVLDLSKPLEKNLNENQIFTLKELQTFHQLNILHKKGFGQGHVEEIKQKLTAYLKGKRCAKTEKIDFLSFIKHVVGAYDRKKIYVALEPYQLHDWIVLSPSEKNEVKYANASIKDAWREEILEKVKKEELLKNGFAKLIATWISPWLYRLGGYSNKNEIVEMLLLRSENEELAYPAIRWILDFYSLDLFLERSQEIYCFSSSHTNFLESFKKTILSYFPSSKNTYSLKLLSSYIQQEFAKKWMICSHEVIEKILNLDSDFKVFFEKDEIQVRLNPKRLFLKRMHHNGGKV